jgi:hypothetical protein
VTVEAHEDFDAAFAQFSTPDDKKVEDNTAAAAATDGAEKEAPAEGAEKEKPAEAAAAAEGAEKEVPAEGEAAAAAEGAEKEVPAEGEAAATAKAAEKEEPAKPAVDSDDVLNRLAKIVSETKAAEPEAKPQAEAAADEAPALYSTEEQEFLAGYDKDWADVVRGEALKRRGEYRDMLQYIFTEVGKFVAPLRDTTTLLAERTHLSDIKSNVPDYSDNLRDQVVAWAKTQPEYLQAAYDQVIQQGTADEVRDLVERYRKETGQVAPAAAAAANSGKDNELSEPAKQAAAALAPVESKRSGVQQASDPSNFDDAWKQFATTSTD